MRSADRARRLSRPNSVPKRRSTARSRYDQLMTAVPKASRVGSRPGSLRPDRFNAEVGGSFEAMLDADQKQEDEVLGLSGWVGVHPA
jgi:hypothetical protein